MTEAELETFPLMYLGVEINGAFLQTVDTPERVGAWLARMLPGAQASSNSVRLVSYNFQARP